MKATLKSSLNQFVVKVFRFHSILHWLSFIVFLSSLIIAQEYSFAQLSNKSIFGTKDYVQSIHAINDVMIHDVVGPTGASRYYAYITMAGYEVVSQQNPDEYQDLKIALNSFPASTGLLQGKIDQSFAIIYSTYRMGEELLPSGFMLDSSKQIVIAKAKKKLDATVLQNTMTFSDGIVKTILQYSIADHYREINTMLKYTPEKGVGYWKPTPPAYTQALDPHWNEIRPFTLDSPAQIKPVPCAPYSEDSSSAFYRLAMETYQVGLHLMKEQIAIANFWDCNPFAVQEVGHIDYGIKKISPGGHWMNITGLACEKKNVSLEKTVQAHTLVAIALADGFISCWDEKFRSNRIRPETFINDHIDRNWRPLIQTPPFPEYPSGHSVASNAAATVLTKLLGDNFKYTDVTEEEFDQPARTFTSFQQAADEASISRLYGGIHFRDAIENGASEGKKIGEWVLKKFGF